VRESFGIVSHRVLSKLRFVTIRMSKRIVKVIPVLGDDVRGRGRIVELPRLHSGSR
jgi:hypothetical protein